MDLESGRTRESNMYDELLASVRARVNRYLNSGDAEDVCHPAGLRDAQALLVVAGELPGGRFARGGRTPLVDAQHAAALLYYARHVAGSTGDDESDLSLAEPLLRPVSDRIPELTEQLRALAEVPAQPVRLSPQRVAVFTFAGSPLHEVDAVIAVTRHAVRAAVDDGTDPLPLRMNLAEAQELRYRRTGEVADLTDAIDTARAVLAETPPDDSRYTNRLTTLGGYLQLRFAGAGNSGDLAASIETLEQALSAAPADHEDRPMYLSNLGRARLTRYAHVSQDLADLDAAFELIRTAVSATPVGDPGLGGRLNALHQTHRLRYARTGDPTYLEAALVAAYQAVEATPPEHGERPERILDVGATHLDRYERTGDKQDAAVAIDIARQVKRVAPRDHPLHAAARELLERARR
ncbi:hypothetical protein [Micromonospora musae]|uniref:hypothetical protein n=1 Tax=Micromonospora musae TaxID=1894970 RepID=UPI0033E941BA